MTRVKDPSERSFDAGSVLCTGISGCWATCDAVTFPDLTNPTPFPLNPFHPERPASRHPEPNPRTHEPTSSGSSSPLIRLSRYRHCRPSNPQPAFPFPSPSRIEPGYLIAYTVTHVALLRVYKNTSHW